MKYYVYILQSLKDQRYYIGFTSNLNKRLAEHNSGKTHSTKHRLPFKLIYSENFSTSLEASNREKEIKRMKGGGQFKKLILKPSSGVRPAKAG